MRFSENRKLAWVILALVIAASLLLGGSTPLRERRNELLKQYNASAYSISAELREMRSNAVKLQSIAAKYPASDKAILSALSDAVALLDAASGDIAAQHTASLQLHTAVENSYANLTALPLSDADASDSRYAYRNFTSAQLRISHDEFNTLADEFNADLSRFPANLIGGICGVKPLDAFR